MNNIYYPNFLTILYHELAMNDFININRTYEF